MQHSDVTRDVRWELLLWWLLSGPEAKGSSSLTKANHLPDQLTLWDKFPLCVPNNGVFCGWIRRPSWSHDSLLPGNKTGTKPTNNWHLFGSRLPLISIGYTHLLQYSWGPLRICHTWNFHFHMRILILTTFSHLWIRISTRANTTSHLPAVIWKCTWGCVSTRWHH